MRRRRRLLLGDEVTENFWPSFADLTSTFALILFVLVLLAYIQNLVAGKNLEHARTQLGLALQRLEASQQKISSSEKRLRLLEDQLRTTAAEIEAGQNRLKLSEEKITQQEELLAGNSRELDTLRTKLSGMAVLRVDVLSKVKRSIEGELSAKTSGAGPVALIGENGNILINESLVFEYNSFTIKKEGKPLLDLLAKAFANVLADGTVRENIDVIVVQGHTDERGSVAFNRDLSAKRANAVLNYMFEANRTLEQSFGSYFASSAYSKFRPVNLARSEAAYEQNRRIEISVVLKDANVRKIIDEYMQNSPALGRPAVPPPPTSAAPGQVAAPDKH